MDEFIRDYRDKEGVGYVIEHGGDGYRWVWFEPPFEPDGDYARYADLADALRAAADDWENNGGPTLRRAATLRAQATRLDKRRNGEHA